MRDHNILTYHNIEARRPDIVKKKVRECFLIDIDVSGDVRVEGRKEKKSEKYKDLRIKIRKLWKVECKIVPIVVGALGTLPIKLSIFISSLGTELSVETIQKAVILRSAMVLKMVLEKKFFECA